MRCCWVISQGLRDHDKKYQKLSDLAPTWGSWKTWKEFNTDNTICTQLVEADNLVGRAFHSVTNLYLPKSFYAELESPRGVKLFEGIVDPESKIDDDIAAVSITSQQYEIVLLLGFEFEEKVYTERLYAIIAGNQKCQFVLIDPTLDPPNKFDELANFACDEFKNVLELLA